MGYDNGGWKDEHIASWREDRDYNKIKRLEEENEILKEENKRLEEENERKKENLEIKSINYDNIMKKNNINIEFEEIKKYLEVDYKDSLFNYLKKNKSSIETKLKEYDKVDYIVIYKNIVNQDFIFRGKIYRATITLIIYAFGHSIEETSTIVECLKINWLGGKTIWKKNKF